MQGVVSQSNFIPWRGYFASLRAAQILVMYDSQQFTRRDWRNRNLILGRSEPEWLTVPVVSKGNYYSSINTIRISDENFFDRALNILENRYSDYSKSEGFAFVCELFRNAKQYHLLSDLNFFFTNEICNFLEIRIKIKSDLGLQLGEGKSQKLIEVCKKFGINEYLTGPAAKSYIDLKLFSQNGIIVKFFEFEKLLIPQQRTEYSIIHHLIIDTKVNLRRLTSFSPNETFKSLSQTKNL